MHLVDVTMFFAREGGGVQRYLMTKHDWLKRHTRVRHTILAPGGTQRDEYADAATIRTIRSPALPFSNGYRFPLRQGPWRRQLVNLAPDLIEAGDPYVPAWAALQAGQRLGVPVIGFYHSDLMRVVGTRLGAAAERATTRYVRQLYADFDAIIAPSRFVCRKLQELGLECVMRQPLGVDTELFHPRRRDPNLRRRLALPDNAHLLVFAGRFAREKNLPLLLSAFRRLGPRYHLLLIGSGMRITQQANVTVLPYQTSNERLASLIASCDALVHAGQQETFGLVVLEAMACGLPVVAADAGGVAELVDHRYGVTVPVTSSAAFADGIEALCSRDMAQLGKRARDVAENAYGWGQVLRSLLAFYSQRLAATAGHAEREAYVWR
jgi:alpha-1,6-mannosyltransferase